MLKAMGKIPGAEKKQLKRPRRTYAEGETIELSSDTEDEGEVRLYMRWTIKSAAEVITGTRRLPKDQG